MQALTILYTLNRYALHQSGKTEIWTVEALPACPDTAASDIAHHNGAGVVVDSRR